MNVYPEYSPRNSCDSWFEVLLIIVEAGCNFVGVIVFIFMYIFIFGFVLFYWSEGRHSDWRCADVARYKDM